MKRKKFFESYKLLLCSFRVPLTYELSTGYHRVANPTHCCPSKALKTKKIIPYTFYLIPSKLFLLTKNEFEKKSPKKLALDKLTVSKIRNNTRFTFDRSTECSMAFVFMEHYLWDVNSCMNFDRLKWILSYNWWEVSTLCVISI